MKLNHLHINVPDIQKAKAFYQDFFNFEVAFDHGDGVFLKDSDGFLVALDPIKEDERVDFPDWYHFGFCLNSAKEVKTLFDKMKSSGVEFDREYKEFGDAAANFYCWAPGPYKLEVTWNKED